VIELTTTQRTADWYAARCARVTASRIADVIGCVKSGAWAAPRAKYASQLVAERLTGKPQDMRQVRSMTDRADMEPEAVSCYEFYTDLDVIPVGFIRHPAIEMAGASPDGLIGSDGGLEIKVLDPATHGRLFKGDKAAMAVMQDYVPQMQWGMACTERSWWDFMAYCPTMPEELKMYRKRIERDQGDIDALETIVRVFLDEVDAEVAQILGGAQ